MCNQQKYCRNNKKYCSKINAMCNQRTWQWFPKGGLALNWTQGLDLHTKVKSPGFATDPCIPAVVQLLASFNSWQVICLLMLTKTKVQFYEKNWQTLAHSEARSRPLSKEGSVKTLICLDPSSFGHLYFHFVKWIISCTFIYLWLNPFYTINLPLFMDSNVKRWHVVRLIVTHQNDIVMEDFKV